jgi:hypothetical protein
MKMLVVAGDDGRLVGIVPVGLEVAPVDGDGPTLRARMVPGPGQQVHELEVEDNLLSDPRKLSRLHEIHRVVEGRLTQVGVAAE